MLLSRRSGVPNRDIADIKSRYEKLCYPMRFELVDKKCEVANPVELLIEEARRISMLFDDIDPIDELDIDENNIPDEPFSLERKPDPYMERLANGARVKQIPDIRGYVMETRESEK